jgi:hypothetical protein
VADGKGGRGLSCAGRAVEEQMGQLQVCRVVSDPLQRQLIERKRRTLPVSRDFLSARTTSSWCATSSTVFGRLMEEKGGGSDCRLKLPKRELIQGIEAFRDTRVTHYFSTQGILAARFAPANESSLLIVILSALPAF